jgi:3-phenylpropionate/trans-cinnamate dioxygenase ferredoxin component
MPLVRLARLADLEPGAGVRVELDGGGAVALFLVLDQRDAEPAVLAEATVYALADRCSHEDEPLHDGWVEGRQVECAAHGSCFDLATGEVLAAPALDPVPAFPVTIRGGDVLVDIPSEWAPREQAKQG